MTPKVSVIIPVYGVEKYIERCARSLFEQTLEDMEFIFVDDCTPDNSMKVLNSVIEEYRLRFAEKHFSVRTVRMPANSGLPAVRRHGIQLATGEYVIHCDSDDWIEPNILEVMYNTAIFDNYDMVICEIDFSNGFELKFNECYNNLELIKATLTGQVIESVCTKLVKRSIYETEGFIFPKDNVNEDCVLSTQLAYYCNSFKQLPDKFYHYDMREDSISHIRDEEKMANNFQQYKNNIALIVKFLENKNLANKMQQELDAKKLSCKNYLIPVISIPRFHQLWKEAYPEISCRLLFNKYVPFRIKCIYYCICFNIYTILKPIFGRGNAY